MTVSGMVARPLLAGMFIYGGIDALKDPEGKAKAVDDVAPMIAEALGLPTTDTVTLVRINGAVHVVAGSLLAIGKCRRLAALTLAASLVPTTYAAHRFWDEVDEEQRARQRIQFLKNASMLGGLILAAADTGGRPSVPWQARRAAKHAVEATVAAGAATQDAAKHLLGSNGSAQDAAGGLGDAASRAATTAKDVAKDAAGGLGDVASRAAVTAKGAAGAGATLATALAKQISEAAEDVDFKAELQKVSRRAARAAEKAQKSELTKRARKAAKKAAKAAQKLELTKRARKAAKKAQKLELTKQARKAAAKAQKAAAELAAEKTADTLARAKGALADVSFDDVRDRASALAHQAGDRVRDALPLAS